MRWMRMITGSMEVVWWCVDLVCPTEVNQKPIYWRVWVSRGQTAKARPERGVWFRFVWFGLGSAEKGSSGWQRARRCRATRSYGNRLQKSPHNGIRADLLRLHWSRGLYFSFPCLSLYLNLVGFALLLVCLHPKSWNPRVLQPRAPSLSSIQSHPSPIIRDFIPRSAHR